MEDFEDYLLVSEEEPTNGKAPGRVPLKERTRSFSLRVIKLYSTLSEQGVAGVIGKQLLRAATSVGAHYREGMHARSDAEFASKLEVGLQELEEARYWIELLNGSGTVPEAKTRELYHEAEPLTAILTACICKAKSRNRTR